MTTSILLNQSTFATAIAATLGSLFADECYEIPASPMPYSRSVAIGVVGGVNASVVVRVDGVVSRAYPAAMFGLPESDVSEVNINDALLELTNVLGGAAKSTLNAGCSLALPEAVELDASWPGTEGDVTLAVGSGFVNVRVVTNLETSVGVHS